MSLPTVGVDTVLGANSFIEVQDVLEFLDAVSRRDQDVLRSLMRRKTEMEQQRDLLEGLEAELRGQRERLEATVADLVEKLQRQRALLRDRAEEAAQDNGSVDSPTPPAPPTPPFRTGSRGRSCEGAHQQALRSPRGPNRGSRPLPPPKRIQPRSIGREPHHGSVRSVPVHPFHLVEPFRPGRLGRRLRVEARANVAVAAWTVAQYGWHP